MRLTTCSAGLLSLVAWLGWSDAAARVASPAARGASPASLASLALPAALGARAESDSPVKLEASLPAGLEGTFRFGGGDAERRQREAAIEDVVSRMNVFVRGIARRRLASATVIVNQVRVSRDGNAVTVEYDGRSYRAELGGAPIDVVSVTGDEVKLTHRVKGDRLIQTFAGKDGGRRNVLSFKGGRLVLRATIFSQRLPKSLAYKLSYEPK